MKLRRQLASAYGPPEIWAVYRGFTVDPCAASPRRHQVAKPSDRPALHEVAVRTSATPLRRHQVFKPSDRPALHEVAVRTSQRPSPRRFRCVRAPGADPSGQFPFSRLVRQAGNTEVEFSKAPTTGPNSSSLTYECDPGQDALERASRFCRLRRTHSLNIVYSLICVMAVCTFCFYDTYLAT